MKSFESQSVRQAFSQRIDSLNAMATTHLSKGECFGFDFVITAMLAGEVREKSSSERSEESLHKEL